MKVNCTICDTEIIRKPNEVLRRKNFYCSVVCRTEGMKLFPTGGQFKIKHKTEIKDSLLKCIRCNEFKNMNDFYKRLDVKNRFEKSYNCKKCELERHKYSYIVSRKAKLKARSKPEGHIKDLLQHAKNRKQSFEITFEYAMDIYNLQKGLCAISNEPMTTISGIGRVDTNISIDRINSNIGYVEGNIQFVCRIINIIKTDLSLSELHNWCIKILKNKNDE